jgi:hypothetical protein
LRRALATFVDVSIRNQNELARLVLAQRSVGRVVFIVVEAAPNFFL